MAKFAKNSAFFVNFAHKSAQNLKNFCKFPSQTHSKFKIFAIMPLLFHTNQEVSNGFGFG